MKIKRLIIFLIFFSLVFLSVQPVLAASLLDGLRPECRSLGNCNLCDFLDLFVNAANILVALSGTFAILMFVYGGIIMITAYGNEARFKWGKDMILATVTGIFIVLLAWTIVNVLIETLYGNSSLPSWYNVNGLCK